MGRLAAAIGALLMLAACSVGEREEPGGQLVGPNRFRYVAEAERGGLFGSGDIFDAEAEQKRLAALDGYVKQNNLCPQGYTVVLRSPGFTFARDDDPQDWFKYVIYLGLCRAAI